MAAKPGKGKCTFLLVPLCLIALALLAVYYVSEIRIMSDRQAGTDFYKFYLSAQSFVQDKSPYWQAPDRENPRSHCYRPGSSGIKPINTVNKTLAQMHPGEQECLHANLNPPIFIALTAPFGVMDFVTGWWLWSGLSLIAGLVGIFVLLNEWVLGKVTSPALTVLSIIVAFFCYFPVIANIQFGQLGLFLFMLLAFAWRDLRHGNDMRAGAILGLAAGIKVFVGLFIVALIIDRRWKSAGAFVASSVVVLLVGYAFLGFAGYQQYFAALADVSWYASNWNASLTGLFYRLLGGGDTPGFFALAQVGKVLVYLSSAFVLAGMLLVIYRINCHHRNHIQLRSDVLFAITLVAMLLLSPLGWMYYFPALAITLSVIWHYSGNISLRNVPLLGTVTFLLLTFAPFTLRKTDKFISVFDWWWTGAFYSYALLVLFAALLYCTFKIIGKQGDFSLPRIAVTTPVADKAKSSA